MFLKRVFAYLFLAVFIYTSVGFYGTFIIQQRQTRKEIKRLIKQGVPEEKLTKLSFDPSSDEYKQLVWVKKNEFRYNGQMFDIVRQSTDENGIIHYACINDKQEEMLFANLDDYIDNDQLPSSGKQKKVNDIFKKLINYHSVFQKCSMDKGVANEFLYPFLSFATSNTSEDIPTPPPRFS